jgi:hypothetical protein
MIELDHASAWLVVIPCVGDGARVLLWFPSAGVLMTATMYTPFLIQWSWCLYHQHQWYSVLQLADVEVFPIHLILSGPILELLKARVDRHVLHPLGSSVFTPYSICGLHIRLCCYLA